MRVMGFYRLLIMLLTPLLVVHLHLRAARGKEDRSRLSERYGRPGPNAQRPTHPTIWVHAASVGEAHLAMMVITRLTTLAPATPIILTTGTVTSAQMVATQMLPAKVTHQYAPLDHPVWVSRFLDFWQPRRAIRLEAEIWPETLRALRARGAKTMLLNAHLSPRSFARWRRVPRLARAIFGQIDTVLADGYEHAARYGDILGRPVTAMMNLKFLAAPLRFDPASLSKLRAATTARPIWIYASTHADEETLAAQTHHELRALFPNLLTLVAPRHPARIDAIMATLAPFNLRVARRSQTPIPDAETEIFIIDTMGEMGLFYALAGVAMVGRSFSLDGGGGHNPIEPARLGCFPISGPAVQNLETIYRPMVDARAAYIVPSPQEMMGFLASHLADLGTLRHRGQGAQDQVIDFGRTLSHDLDQHLIDFLRSGDTP
jgi:3-deoxy-D-manno-octulosonic-acid transferase